MSPKALLERFMQSSLLTKLLIGALILIWSTVFVGLIVSIVFLREKSGSAQIVTNPGATPTITLAPSAGPLGTTINITGEGWRSGGMIMIYLLTPEEATVSGFASAGTAADAGGRFTGAFVLPDEPRWQNQLQAVVLARSVEDNTTARAIFTIIPAGTATAIAGTAVPELTATVTPAATLAPIKQIKSTVTASIDLNIRSGPGSNYAVIGLLRSGQTVNVNGASVDGQWLLIQADWVDGGQGWISAKYITEPGAVQTAVVQPPAATATLVPPSTLTPTPAPAVAATATPIVITDWKGEYYNNSSLSGSPVMVRNDADIDFNWGGGSPASGLPADHFSVRWTRSEDFADATYRFTVTTDDGVRLWLDGNLIIDEWHDNSTTYYKEVAMSSGTHSLKMEYYENAGDAVAKLSWEKISSYPDWKAEYFDNMDLDGNPVLVRNEGSIDHDWGSGSPGNLPTDEFSARYTRTKHFSSGNYIFTVRVDDGVRLWVDGKRLINSWTDGSERTLTAEKELSHGDHDIKVEYFEEEGDAVIKVSWEKESEATATPTPTKTRTPTSQPPQAKPGGPYSVKEGNNLILSGSSSTAPGSTITAYDWDCNYNGGFSVSVSGETAVCKYTDGPKTVTVALRVTNSAGATNIGTTTVNVANVSPTADAGGPYSGLSGSAIQMTGAASDPGSQDLSSLNYSWDFGDGQQGSGKTVSHIYSSTGQYTVTLTVTDKDGGAGTDTAVVTVGAILPTATSTATPTATATETPTSTPTATATSTSTPQPTPKAVISGPTEGLTGEELSYNGSGSTGNITDYDWNFGDGKTASGVSAKHTYSAAGNFTVTLTVTDDLGRHSSDQQGVTISAPPNQPPQAAISVSASPRVSQTVTFSGSGSTDSDGTISSYAWHFGDGTSGSGETTTHTYSIAGFYQLTLTVTDNDGAKDSAQQILDVLPAEGAVLTASPGGPYNGAVNQVLNFSGSGSGGTIDSYEWDFNYNGTTFIPTATGSSVTHTYTLSGVYPVVLRVHDSAGNTAMGMTLAVINQ